MDKEYDLQDWQTYTFVEPAVMYRLLKYKERFIHIYYFDDRKRRHGFWNKLRRYFVNDIMPCFFRLKSYKYTFLCKKAQISPKFNELEHNQTILKTASLFI